MEFKAEPYLRNVRNLSDARFAASESFFALSFEVDSRKEEFLGFEEIKEMANWISGPIKVGAVSSMLVDVINDTIERCALEAVELDAALPLEKLKAINSQLFLRLHASDVLLLEKEKFELASFLLIEGSLEELIGNKKTLKRISLLNTTVPTILDVGDNIHEQEKLIEALEPFGLALKGGDELKTGMRSFDDLNERLDLLRY